MSSEGKPEKPREDDFRETPEWHRARAQGLRKNGFTNMAEEHEQIAQAIERGRQQQTKYVPPARVICVMRVEAPASVPLSVRRRSPSRS
jgi:hypothetical protein